MTVWIRIHQALSYIKHRFHAVNEHAVHSPYFFDFYLNVIIKSRKRVSDHSIEMLRTSLTDDDTEIETQDMGAGSTRNGKQKTISGIAKTSLSPARISLLYQCILEYIDAQSIVELGTSLGINALYLSGKENSRVYTFEGDPTLAGIALKNFKSCKKQHITLIEGEIDSTLPDFLQRVNAVDFALIDAHHRYEPTLRYFSLLVEKMNERGIIIVDDIYWSEEMEKAWYTLKHHQRVYGSIDLYRCGILFLNPSLNNQHFIFSY